MVGPRRQIASDVPLDRVVLNILDGDLGEPLGALADTLEPDDHGIMWWAGNPPQWRNDY
jgi:hypothetical protein